MIGYCPNCGAALEHDGDNAACDACGIEWNGGASIALRPEPYEAGELEAEQAARAARMDPPKEKHRAT